MHATMIRQQNAERRSMRSSYELTTLGTERTHCNSLLTHSTCRVKCHQQNRQPCSVAVVTVAGCANNLRQQITRYREQAAGSVCTLQAYTHTPTLTAQLENTL